MIKKLVFIGLTSLIFCNSNSQSLSLNNLIFYLNPANFKNDSILLQKGFKIRTMTVVSEQELMYCYFKSGTEESFYYGGIDQIDNYRKFHISYYFDSSAYNNFLSLLTKNYTYKGVQWNESKKYESDKYIFYLYPKDLIKIFSKQKSPLLDKCILDGFYNEIENTFKETTNSFFIDFFDENSISIITSKVTGSVGMINKSGEIIVVPKYANIFYFSNGFYCISAYDDSRGTDPNTGRYYLKYGIIDKNGKELLPINYDEIEMIDSNNFSLRKNGVESQLSIPQP